MNKLKPSTIRTMARHRGLSINKAIQGGWYVTLASSVPTPVLYCSHDWNKIRMFVKRQPRLVLRAEIEQDEAP